ncbi:MAG: TIGR01212 family radical SAM protein, partial [Spirochaetales bacterium]|nr:TIGR01212 family radical SAM protein [Candidatus Physcosoma equi]
TGSVAVYQRTTESGFMRNAVYEEKVASTILDRFASIEKQIAKGLEFIHRRYKAEEVALYFQSWTNTYDSTENLKKIHDKALSCGDFREFIVSTRPDCMSEEVCALLSSYRTEKREVWVELGLQSSNNETLLRINRGHSAECYLEAAERAHRYGLKIYTHEILGLPGEDQEDYIATIQTVNKAKSEAVKIHNLHIAGGTKMADEYYDGEIATSSTMRHLENSQLALRHLSPEIVVQRMICETPMHRLVAPRHFMDKSLFLRTLNAYMEKNGTRQGDLYFES